MCETVAKPIVRTVKTVARMERGKHTVTIFEESNEPMRYTGRNRWVLLAEATADTPKQAAVEAILQLYTKANEALEALKMAGLVTL